MRSLKIYLVLFSIFFIISCESPFHPNGDDDDPPPPPVNECAGRPLTASGNVGDTLRTCHFEVTLKWAIRTDLYKDFYRPRDRENNTLIILYVKVKLLKAIPTARTYLCQSDVLKLEDEKGITYLWNGNGIGDTELKSTYLDEGQEATGEISIEIPKRTAGLIAVFWAGNYSSNTQYKDEIRWKLSF